MCSAVVAQRNCAGKSRTEHCAEKQQGINAAPTFSKCFCNRKHGKRFGCGCGRSLQGKYDAEGDGKKHYTSEKHPSPDGFGWGHFTDRRQNTNRRKKIIAKKKNGCDRPIPKERVSLRESRDGKLPCTAAKCESTDHDRADHQKRHYGRKDPHHTRGAGK